MVSQAKIDEFHKNSGEVLRLELEIESQLDMFFYNYFCKIEDNRLLLFKEILLPKLNFESKIRIFKKICEYEKLDTELTQKVYESVKFIQEARNKVAHGGIFIKNVEEGPLLYKGGWITSPINELKLDSDFMEAIKNKRLISIQGIDNLLNKLLDPDRFKKIKIE